MRNPGNKINTSSISILMSILILSLAVLQSGCGKKSVPAHTPLRTMNSVSTPDLKHKRVQELFVVIFEKNYSPEEWKEIFDQTRLLSANKKQLRAIEGQDSEEVSILRSKLIQENAEILTRLGSLSLFMLNWSAQDENCRFAGNPELKLICKPRNPNNPLNGGLPFSPEAATWVIPNPALSEVKTPYLKFLLRKQAERETDFAYDLELRLKIEKVLDESSWFKGEALPAPGSRFQKPDGTLTGTFFTYGYSELTLSP